VALSRGEGERASGSINISDKRIRHGPLVNPREGEERREKRNGEESAPATIIVIR
jgi:hypothetical protein